MTTVVRCLVAADWRFGEVARWVEFQSGFDPNLEERKKAENEKIVRYIDRNSISNGKSLTEKIYKFKILLKK